MNSRPLLLLAAIAAATSPDMGKNALDRFKGGVRDGFARDPMGSVLAAVLGGAWLFYKAERGHNPKVKSYYDALVYVSTNLSVGYSDIFARTPRGKAIGTALMTYGPAMSAKIFDTPTAPAAPAAAAVAQAAVPAPVPAPAALVGSKEVLDRLDRILAMLEANRDARRDAQPPTT
jgi:voltage-gated potassium channel